MRPPRWSVNEQTRLETLIESGASYSTIAKRLKRSRNAVQIKCQRMRLRVRCVRATLSTRDVAATLGLSCSKTVVRWIERYGLRATNGGDTRPLWRVQWDDLLDWMEDRAHWMAYDPTRILDLALREWACELRTGPHRWLTPGQVGTRLHVGVGAVNDWIMKGEIPATRYGNWWVWSGDLDGFVIPGNRPHSTALHPDGLPVRLLPLLLTPQTSDALAFVLDARPASVRQALRILLARGLVVRHGTRKHPTWTILTGS